jgi:hypothetical protein
MHRAPIETERKHLQRRVSHFDDGHQSTRPIVPRSTQLLRIGARGAVARFAEANRSNLKHRAHALATPLAEAGEAPCARSGRRAPYHVRRPTLEPGVSLHPRRQLGRARQFAARPFLSQRRQEFCHDTAALSHAHRGFGSLGSAHGFSTGRGCGAEGTLPGCSASFDIQRGAFVVEPGNKLSQE